MPSKTQVSSPVSVSIKVSKSPLSAAVRSTQVVSGDDQLAAAYDVDRPHHRRGALEINSGDLTRGVEEGDGTAGHGGGGRALAAIHVRVDHAHRLTELGEEQPVVGPYAGTGRDRTLEHSGVVAGLGEHDVLAVARRADGLDQGVHRKCVVGVLIDDPDVDPITERVARHHPAPAVDEEGARADRLSGGAEAEVVGGDLLGKEVRRAARRGVEEARTGTRRPGDPDGALEDAGVRSRLGQGEVLEVPGVERGEDDADGLGDVGLRVGGGAEHPHPRPVAFDYLGGRVAVLVDEVDG
ncbi:MAG: hypothetical protein GY856_30535, partial [bacterium]|nr:hypothetical protein [bacterium]